MEIKSKLMKSIGLCVARYYLKKPDQADIISIKHPDLSDLGPAFLNEICYRMRLKRSFRLTSLNIELTNRCNLSCIHCPKKDGFRREERDMDFKTFKGIIDQTPHLKTLLPFQWGEPLMNPEVYRCIAYAASRGIRVMLTTNGTLLDEKACNELMEAGLSRLTVSFEGNRETHSYFRGIDADAIINNVTLFRKIRDARGTSCALDVSMVVDAFTEPYRKDIFKIFSGVADRIQYIPRFERKPRNTPCRELWRGLLVVLSNGDVTLCCVDTQGEAAVGNVSSYSPNDLFNHKIMQNLRYRHSRCDFPLLCRWCGEYSSPRVSPRFS